MTAARQLQAFTNVNRAENSQPFDDVSLFLPHPAEFRVAYQNRTLNVTRQTAIAVLQSIDWLDSSVLAAIDSWLPELELITSDG